MQTILADLQNNLSLFLVALFAGLIIGCLFSGIIMAIRGRSRLTQQQTLLEDEFNQKQQLFTEREQQLEAKNAENKHQLEIQLIEKDNHIELIEKQLELSTNEITERIPKLVTHIKSRNHHLHDLLAKLESKLELTEQPVPDEKDIWAKVLWQRHDEVTSQAIDRLNKEAQTQIELKQTNEQSLAKLTEKETAIQDLKNKMAEQVNGISQLETDLETQNRSIEQLQLKENEIVISHEENLKQNLSRISELESERTELNNVLGNTQQQSAVFEQKIKEQDLQIEQNTAKQQTALQQAQENRGLQDQIENNNSRLKGKLETLEADFNLTASAQLEISLWDQYDELMSQLAKRIQTLEAYTTTEAQNSTEETKTPEQEDILEEPASVDNTAQNEAPSETIKETESREETSHEQAGVVDTIKKQFDATTEKTKTVPTYFKDLFNEKIKSLKNQKID